MGSSPHAPTVVAPIRVCRRPGQHGVTRVPDPPLGLVVFVVSVSILGAEIAEFAANRTG